MAGLVAEACFKLSPSVPSVPGSSGTMQAATATAIIVSPSEPEAFETRCLFPPQKMYAPLAPQALSSNNSNAGIP